MKKRIVAGVVLVTFIIGLAGVVLAEPKRKEKIQQRVEMMLMWKLTNALDLDVETAAKLFPLVSKQAKERRAFVRKAKNIFDDMKDALAEDSVDEEALRKYISDMEEIKAGMDEMQRRHLTELKKILSVEQQARLFLVLPEFTEGLRNVVAEARRFGRRGRGQGSGWRGPWGMSEEERSEWRGRGR